MPALMMNTMELSETAYLFWDAFHLNVPLMTNVELEESVLMVLATTSNAAHPVTVMVDVYVTMENAGIPATTPRIAPTFHRVISANMDSACAREVCAKRNVYGFKSDGYIIVFHSRSNQSSQSFVNLKETKIKISSRSKWHVNGNMT